MMESLFIALTWATLNWVSLASPTKSMVNTESASSPDNRLSPDEAQARQTVISFLNWYKNNIQEANRIQLVNQTQGKPYSVNLKNGERYLTYLKSSQLLTDAYLNQWRVFFKERQEGFRQSPQDEGPPTGFDYDLVLLTQDVDMQLAALKSMKMGKAVISNGKATVEFTLQDAYEFRLMRRNGRWLINEILNQSQE